jgi:hypothetical protein
MYKNNSRDSSKFEVCSPLQLPCNLTGKCHAIGYYSYTHRCAKGPEPRLVFHVGCFVKEGEDGVFFRDSGCFGHCSS